MEKLDLEYKVYGEGDSTIVIESGIGCSFYDWYPLVQKIKKDFKVVLYHRSGYGNSPDSTNTRTTMNIARELHYLLDQIGISEKFTLLGHSFGGLCVQQYAKMYPNQLNSIVLVDSTSPNFKQLYNLDIPVMNSLISIDKMIESNRTSSSKSKEELLKTFQFVVEEQEKILPQSMVRNFKEFISNPLLFKKIAEEFANWEASSEIITEMSEFPNIPLLVMARDKELSATPFIEHGIPENEAVLYEQVWRNLQVELSKLSSKGKFIIAEKSDHEIHKDRPDIIIEELYKLSDV